MSKRVYELAKEMGVTSRDVLQLLAALGVVAKSHASTVDDATATRVKEAVARVMNRGAAAKPAATRPARPAARPAAQRPPAERPSAERAPRPGGNQPQQQRRPGGPPQRGHQQPGRHAPAAAQQQPRAPQPARPDEPAVRKAMKIHRGATVQELAEKLSIKAAEVVKKLFTMGEMATITKSLSDEALVMIGDLYNYDVDIVTPEEEEQALLGREDDDKPEDLKGRPPVITVMGHVDHGKTKLLDQIRQTDVVAGEAGGITQHIGAYQVHKNGQAITFIDTPGHEAFTQMRARGARITDIAVLVVAADDGVKPQTIEAISHARAAEVPIVVAVNKIDKPEADPTRVRQQLTEHELVPEEWGGDSIFVDISAKEGLHIDKLLEMLLLVAEVQELKANPDARARGTVIEAHLDKGRGPVATVLVARGTLKIGDSIVCGPAWCRVRAMFDEHGRPLKEVSPGSPAVVIGFSEVPIAGEDFRAVENDRTARQVAQDRVTKQRAADMVSAQKRVSMQDLFGQAADGEISELNVILKGDVQGSVEAIDDALAKIKVGDIRVRVLHRAVGGITENDVSLAQASGAVVIGFNVRPSPAARDLAEREKVEIRTYTIIYKLVEEVEAALKGMLKPEFAEHVLGRAEVRATFKVPKIGMIAGCYVAEGVASRNAKVRLLRDGVVLADTTVSSLKRFKDDAKEVQTGYECGIGLEGYNDLKEGDHLEFYEVREVPRD
ncbi:MAG TPA: translation initiation factor IF-2 [Actinomycetota bacterium]|nr:translation initiation factor IF-2 [Actinomycetota bacterium]